MANRKNRRVSRRSFRPQHHIFRHMTFHRMIDSVIRWVLRILFKLGEPPRRSRAGFVLPTTVMLLLVVTLTVGSISLRTLNRTGQVIGDRQQRVIYNAATPAIDRAKAKLEFLFDAGQDDRLPTGIPAEQQLLKMMLNKAPADPNNIQADELRQKLITVPDPANTGATIETDPYTFPDELQTAQALGFASGRLDLDGDSEFDNAWVYFADMDSDGQDDALVAYSILFETPDDISTLSNASDQGIAARANALQVRNGPLSSIVPDDPACQNRSGAPPIESGWFTDFAAVRKNFQVNAVVIPIVTNDDGTFSANPTGTTAALEFQQDRQYDEGNKWGAWFRNDLEIFAGPTFNWNGAMHTEGNLIVGRRSFTAFLISSPKSCLYDRQASEITIAEISEDNLDGLPAFTGQMVGGELSQLEEVVHSSRYHIQGNPDPILQNDQIALEVANDSIKDAVDPVSLSLDPVKLFTEDVSVPRSTTPIDFADIRDEAWQDRLLSSKDEGRVYNQSSERAPRIDDFYRADNRLGPRPRYGRDPIPGRIGEKTTADDYIQNDAVGEEVGLDGYWERRARREGMRLIVGQRLELGNPFGWQGNDDALYPWDDTTCTERCYEAKQRRMLRDNLASVQALAAYHALGGDDGDFPRFCMAVAAHPGTPKTIEDSTAFNELPVTPPSGFETQNIDISFFDGHGTNGWEYPAPATAATFASEIAPNRPLGRALRNLAHFAGDPLGGVPSFTPTQDSAAGTDPVVHPYPNLTMWGDFSMMRRIFDEELDAGSSYTTSRYDALSVADKTYLHTAACMVGMLANNIDMLTQIDYDEANNATLLTNLNAAILAATAELDDDNFANGEMDDLGSEWRFYPIGGDGSFFTTIEKVPGTTDLPPEAIIAALPDDQQKRLAQILHLKEQVARDRQFGFVANPTPAYDCGLPIGLSDLSKLCPIQPKFPALYYVFPKESHRHDGNLPGGLPPFSGSDQTPTGESYILDPYIFDLTDPTRGANDDYVYSVIGSSADDFAGVALAPRATVSDWEIDPMSPAAESSNLISVSGTDYAIALLDKGVYNGREHLNTRVLDMDLDMLRKATLTDGTSTDTWLPKLNLVYAFREDAVREDNLVRPASLGPCTTDAEIQSANCLMDAVSANPQDPPLTADKSISPKVVDYYADPDRRPNGFRLSNGKSVKRDGDEGRGLTFISDNLVYIKGDFNLHQNRECGTDDCRIEEFDQLLPDDGRYNPQEFYTNRTDLNPDFARQDSDFWRPTEILADSVTIVSDNFCDGSVADGFLTASVMMSEVTTASTSHAGFPGYDTSVYGCGGDRTSYLNQNRPTRLPSSDIWRRENQFDFNSPIAITKNGVPLDAEDLTELYSNGNYFTFNQGGSLIPAAPTRVNAVIISGLIPSRPDQVYGGLHNFPRLLEDWTQVRLAISGAFIQLNFSTSSTAPYDQTDLWEPAANPTPSAGSIDHRYYFPPIRAWGYDVGLQYAPAAPIAKRLASPGSFRSEFYSEPPADDQYIANLRAAIAPALTP